MLDASPSMRAYDNEISVALLGDAHNRFRWVPGSEFNFPGAVKGLWYEVAELGQCLLIVVMAYHCRLRWSGSAKATTHDWIKARLRTGSPCNEVDLYARMRRHDM
jgi:hypothetical protein